MDLKVDCCMHLINMHGSNILVLTCLQRKCQYRTWMFNLKQHFQIILDLKKINNVPNRSMVITKCFMNKGFVAFQK